jgi:hypothetical protein
MIIMDSRNLKKHLMTLQPNLHLFWDGNRMVGIVCK